MRVDVFIPSLVDQFAPELGFKLIQVLEEIGCKVDYNPNQTDSGDMAFKTGYWEDAKEIGEKLLKDFNEDQCVISPSASSVEYIRNHHEELFQNTTLHNQHKLLQKNIFELCEFLVGKLKITQLNASFTGRIAIHPSCSIYGKRSGEYMEALLGKVKGVELVPTDVANESCGANEEYISDAFDLSFRMGEQQLNAAYEAGASYLVVNDIECYLHLQQIQQKKDLKIQVLHVLDVIVPEL